MIEIKGKEVEGINPYAMPGIIGYGKKVEATLQYDDIADIVCGYMGIDKNMIWKKNRKRRLVTCRWMICFFSNKYVEGCKSDIANFLKLDHTTILHGLKTLGDLYDTEEGIRDIVKKIDFQIKLRLKLNI